MKTKGVKPFTCRALHDKEKRNLAILELIRKKGVISRSDISRTTGINVVSVSNYINNFIDKKLVLEKGQAASSGGRKPELVELDCAENFALGIDVSAHGVSAVRTDIGMNVIRKQAAPRPALKSDLAEAAIALVNDTVKAANLSVGNIKTAGIGVCEDELAFVGSALEERFNMPFFVGDESTCSAFAEKLFNPSSDVARLLYIHSDLGSGVVIDEALCIGSANALSDSPDKAKKAAAGADAERVKYLRPWSEYLSVVNMARREVERGVGTKIVSLLAGRDVDGLTEDIVIEAARQKDETASNIIETASINLGLRIAYLINLFGPQAVVIAGGPEKAADMTFPFISRMINKLSIREHAKTVGVFPGTLGDDRLSLGAATLAVRELFLNA